MHCFMAKGIVERLGLKSITVAQKMKTKLFDIDSVVSDHILIG